MSSLNQLISELAHSVQQADSVPVRRAMRLGIIHARNDLIRKDQGNNKNVDKVLQQRFRLSLVNVVDGDNIVSKALNAVKIKRTVTKVPRPTRLANGMPFLSVRTMGYKNPTSFAFVKESSSQFYASLPGMCNVPTYDYINEYITIDILKDSRFDELGNIIVESIFEYPQLIKTETQDGVLDLDSISDDDEFLLPEDMIQSIKKVVLDGFNINVVRQTNEIPTPNLVK